MFGHVVLLLILRGSKTTSMVCVRSVKLLVFITKKKCVYCAVRTESLNVILVNFIL